MDGNVAGWDSINAWRRLRLEMEASKHYWRSNLLHGGMAHPDKIVEALLPGLLYIKAVALFDEALEQWLDSAGHKLTKPYKDDLNGRLDYLADSQLLTDVKPLHLIRRMRNTLAHEAGASCSWGELERDTSTMEVALLHFGIVKPTKKLEWFGERSAIEASSEPGVAWTRRFSYGVKEDGHVALEVSWIEKLHND